MMIRDAACREEKEEKEEEDEEEEETCREGTSRPDPSTVCASVRVRVPPGYSAGPRALLAEMSRLHLPQAPFPCSVLFHALSEA